MSPNSKQPLLIYALCSQKQPTRNKYLQETANDCNSNVAIFKII